MPDISELIHDPAWFAHHVAREVVQFVHLPRAAHRAATFLADEYFDAMAPRRTVALADVTSQAADLPPRTCHFIFHSAFCGSTLLSRLLDVDGVCMGLKEPAGLNDLANATRTSMGRTDVRPVLRTLLALYARPFEKGETMIVKPSNVANTLIEDVMAISPSSRAILLYRPLPAFLRSIAAKGLFARIWMRRLSATIAQMPEFDAGFSDAERWEQTDLQVAAMAWLQQQAQFARLVRSLGPARVGTLDSSDLLDDVAGALAAAGRFFNIADPGALAAAANSPARFQDSKRHDRPFDPAAYQEEQEKVQRAHGDEIAKVVDWAEAVAAHCNIPMALSLPLIARI